MKRAENGKYEMPSKKYQTRRSGKFELVDTLSSLHAKFTMGNPKVVWPPTEKQGQQILNLLNGPQEKTVSVKSMPTLTYCAKYQTRFQYLVKI